VTSLLRYEAPELHPIGDDDVAEAAGAVARTLETASRGIIYEHRPASPAAGRLAAALTTVLREAGKGQPASFDRDAAVVLERVERAVRQRRTEEPSNRRAWLELAARVFTAESTQESIDVGGREAPRLIVP
jgi:hypothetical protein